MSRPTEHDLQAALRRDWPKIREEWRRISVLPSCSTHQWILEKRRVGYVTLDYRLHENIEIPGAWGEEGSASAPLVEQYWSVRTLDGQQNPSWLPSLNIHVIFLRNRKVDSADAEEIIRIARVLQMAAQMAGQQWFVEPKRAELYVRSLLLGRTIGADADVIAAIDSSRLERDQAQFAVAQFSHTLAAGFSLSLPRGGERLSDPGLFHQDEVRELGVRLLGDDSLPTLDFAWPGTNDGPIYDSVTKLTIHKGLVK